MHEAENYSVGTQITLFSSCSAAQHSIKLPHRRGLLGAYAAADDVCFEIILAADWSGGQAAQHGQLPDVGEGVGDGSLE